MPIWKKLKKIDSKMRLNAIVLSCLFLLLVAALTNSQFLTTQGPDRVVAQDGEAYQLIDEPNQGTTFSEGEPEPIADPNQGTTFYESNPEPIPDLNQGTTFYEGNPTPISQPEAAPVQQQTYSAPTVVRSYPECTGSPGMVQDVDQMSDGTYRTYNQHYQAGACGDVQQQPFQPQAQQAAPTVVRTYSECAGGSGRVHQVDQMSDGTYRTYNEHTQTGACGDDGRDRDGASVVRTYPECTGTPGMVRDVEQLSNGGYRTFNDRYQAGACGDQRQLVSAPTPTPTPFVTSYLDYRCEGTTQVYYRIYNNGRQEPTGQRNTNSSTCGYSPTTFSSSGSTASNFVPMTAQTQHSSLSANCVASPSQVSTNQSVTWRAMTTGGSGSFDIRWSGEGINGQSGSTILTSYPSSGTKTAQATIRDTISGQTASAACSVSILSASMTPAPTPFVQPNPSFNPIVTPVITNPQPSNVQCPAGTIERSRTGSQLTCERQSNTPTATVVNSSNPAQCPAGTVEKSRNNNEIICERQTTTATSVTVNQTSGATTIPTKEAVTVLTQGDTSIKELPKTGLPLAAVGMASLAPLGLRIKKLLGNREVEESPNSVWMQRQGSI